MIEVVSKPALEAIVSLSRIDSCHTGQYGAESQPVTLAAPPGSLKQVIGAKSPVILRSASGNLLTGQS